MRAGQQLWSPTHIDWDTGASELSIYYPSGQNPTSPEPQRPRCEALWEPGSKATQVTSETLRNEVIDLYTRKTSPVNSILMVTHSISEGVFMATRLVVMGAHPGKVRVIRTDEELMIARSVLRVMGTAMAT